MYQHRAGPITFAHLYSCQGLGVVKTTRNQLHCLSLRIVPYQNIRAQVLDHKESITYQNIRAQVLT